MTDPLGGGDELGPGVVAPGPSSSSLFGDRLDLAASFAALLVTEGVTRGLIGPREAPRIWERHLDNCAVLSEKIDMGASVVDVGSGAGLPGIVLAVVRPDLHITLVEPLARRTAFLTEAVTELGLSSAVTVVRGRAEEVRLEPADVVTARAVAPLDRLARWCLPLAAVGGRVVAMKGSSAAAEVSEHAAEIGRLGGAAPVVSQCGVGVIDPPTTVVEIVRERVVGGSRSWSSRSGASRGSGAFGASGRGSGASSRGSDGSARGSGGGSSRGSGRGRARKG
jgi:16S rRNA (guanine527-N7)-methyltransferase